MNAISDFADWFSPMLVKELRQGLRTRVFVSSFLLLQITLVFSIAVSVISREATGFGFDGGAPLFWGIIGLFLLLVLPARGYTAIGREVTANTLELLYLSRLSVSRIVLGKWVAMIAQIGLFVCSVLPYLLLRYFLGSVNVVQELAALGWMTLASLLFSAVAVASSCFHKARILRVLITVGSFIGIQVGNVFASSRSLSGGAAGVPISLTLLAFIPLFLLLILQTGASKIAPKAESHAGLIRGCGLLAIGLVPLLVLCGNRRELAQWLAGIILFGTVIPALCEQPPRLPGVYVPFLKRGLPGQVASWFLLPGWQSGFFYSLIALVLFGLFGLERSLLTVDHEPLWLTVLGSVFFPAAILKLFFPNRKQQFAIYLGIVVAMFLLAVLVSVMEHTPYDGFTAVAQPFPVAMLYLGLIDSAASKVSVATWSVSLLSVAVLLVLALRTLRQLKPLRVQAQALLESDAD